MATTARTRSCARWRPPGAPSYSAAGTVAIGLLALVVVPVPFIRSVGYGGLLIPLVSVAVAVTLLPIFCWSSGGAWTGRTSAAMIAPADPGRAGRSSSSAHRRSAATIAVVIIAALVIAATSINLGPANGNPDTISQRGEAKQGLQALERSGIGDGVLSPIEITTHQANLTTLLETLKNISGVNGAGAPGERGLAERRHHAPRRPPTQRIERHARPRPRRPHTRFDQDAPRRRDRRPEQRLHLSRLRQLPVDDRLYRAAYLCAVRASVPLAAAARQGGLVERAQRRGGMGCPHARLAAWLRLRHTVWGIPARDRSLHGCR